MSEYQYYEFAAVDRPLTKAQMSALRALSTRARITPMRFVNEYHWGDFKGSPKKLMEEFFDGHLYVANWGTRILQLRLPSAQLALAALEDYLVPECFEAWEAHGNTILDFNLNSEDGCWEDNREWGGGRDDGDDDDDDNEFVTGCAGDGIGAAPGSLGTLLQLRAELARGDLRALYLGWLHGASNGDLDEDAQEPAVPPGLGELTGAQLELVRFLKIDADLLAAAAGKSAPFKPDANAARREREALCAWLAALPNEQKDAWLARLAGVGTGGDKEGGNVLDSQNEPVVVAAELRRAFLEAHMARQKREGRAGDCATTARDDATERRTARALEQRAREIADDRKTRAAAEAARRKAERERAAAIAREAHLDRQAAREHELWPAVRAHIATRLPKEYDQAAALLLDLRDLARRRGESAAEEFDARLRELRAEHSRKPTMCARMDKALASG